MNLLARLKLKFNPKPAPQFVSGVRYFVPRDELAMVVRRGLNTLDPQKMPEWMHDLSDDLASKEDTSFAILVSK